MKYKIYVESIDDCHDVLHEYNFILYVNKK